MSTTDIPCEPKEIKNTDCIIPASAPEESPCNASVRTPGSDENPDATANLDKGDPETHCNCAAAVDGEAEDENKETMSIEVCKTEFDHEAGEDASEKADPNKPGCCVTPISC